MKKLIKKVCSELKAEFINIKPLVMRGVFFSLRQEQKNEAFWQKQCDEILSEDEQPPTSEERDNLLYELLLRYGQRLCTNKKFLQLTEKLALEVREDIRAGRLKRSLSKPTTVAVTGEETSETSLRRSKRHCLRSS